MELIAASIGLGVGGLINMLADSLPRDRRPVLPHCPACTAPRTMATWLGVGSLLVKSWRCPYCGTARSWRVLLIEAATIFGALWLYRRNPEPLSFWSDLFILATFIIIVVIDIEHRLILHAVTGPAALIIGLVGLLNVDKDPGSIVLGGLVGLALVLGMYLLGGVFARIMARIRGQILDEVVFGFGDVTLAGLLGLTVGYPGILVALFLGILTAGEFSLVYILFMLIRGRYQAFIPIPYGPFLVLGTGIVYFGGRTVVESIFPYGPLFFLVGLIVFFVGWAALERILGYRKYSSDR